MSDRLVEDYARHKLVAAREGSSYVGKAWKDGKAIAEVTGSSIDNVVADLRALIDSALNERATNAAPTDDQYVEALRAILPSLSERHVAMLRAHCRASNSSLTATQLAEAAGYANYSAVNLQYGIVGRRLWEELPTRLDLNAERQPVYTSALADAGDRTMSEDQWVWRLRPGVAAAIRTLGLDK